MTSDTMVSSALLDLLRAARLSEVAWALIGGEALIAYGVPRNTLDADALTDEAGLEVLAGELVDTFGWTPVSYDEVSEDYVTAGEVTVHFMDDPVLFDIQQERRMVPLRTPLGLSVELLAAQHPVEMDMVTNAALRTHQGVRIPIAPLGGILLVKTKADRSKDIAAIEQTGEHLPAAQVKAAVDWARSRDSSTADDLEGILRGARVRRSPRRIKPYGRKR